MSDALNKLIDAVEAGTLTGDDDLSYPAGVPEMIDTALGMDTVWDTVCLAHDGSLDAADTLMTILPEGAKWMRMSDGAFIVWLPGTPISASADATGNISRDLFLAILRAYRSVQA